MTLRVLVSAPYMLPVLDRVEALFHERSIEMVVPDVDERLEESELLQWISGIDGVVCGDDRFTSAVIDAADRLPVIAKWGTGIDSIDEAACARRGIRVCNTPGAFTDPVADSVMGYVLAFARRLPWMDRSMKAQKWKKLPGFSLKEATLGIVGVGQIGQAVARRAHVFGTNLLGTDPRLPPESFRDEVGIEMVALDRLLTECDFVSLNCDLNPTSRHLISEQELNLMRASAVLINTARGPVVDEEALVTALRDGSIGGAALDVFEAEPLPRDSALRRMDSVMLAPHNANSSPKAWERVHESTLRQLFDALEVAPL